MGVDRLVKYWKCEGFACHCCGCKEGGGVCDHSGTNLRSCDASRYQTSLPLFSSVDTPRADWGFSKHETGAYVVTRLVLALDMFYSSPSNEHHCDCGDDNPLVHREGD